MISHAVWDPLRYMGTLGITLLVNLNSLIFLMKCGRKSFYLNYKAASVAHTHLFPYKAIRYALPVNDA